jgi:transcriptional regulator
LSTKIKPKASEIEWRRSKVVELRARGFSHTEIARELQVSKASISLDMQYLREQAKGTIREYVTEHLPEQYQVCLSALDTILKHAFEILETSEDKREKIQALSLAKECYSMKLELLTNATVVGDAVRFVSEKSKEKLKSSANDSEHDKEESNEPDHDEDQLEEEQKEETGEITTNQVF